MCNMSYEREFCGLSEYVQHQKLRPLIKSTALFMQGVVDLVYADLKSIIEFGGFISSFSFKYHIFKPQVAYRPFCNRPDFTSKQGFSHSGLWPQ